MKKSFKKLSIVALLVAAAFFISNLKSVEPAEAYYGNWKSQTQTCTVVTTTSEVILILGGGSTGTIKRVVETTTWHEGTQRVCVDGSGWCFWGSSCS